ncbi:MAG: hypothetical protein A4E42_00803 [Methanoregulaceae archaeon PtaU1.Bin222]|nr:MAG: hypothetical protein A4E42_00803 [Methanoregulaceae archaeon PtaU1.Bin222]
MVTMFIPMASLVSNSSRTKTDVPTTVVTASMNFPWDVVDSAARPISSRWEATQSATSLAWGTLLAAKTGALVIPSRRILASAPPARVIALHPLFTEATSAPSVVARGRKNSPDAYPPFTRSGPATPSGTWTVPIMFSQFFLATLSISMENAPTLSRDTPDTLSMKRRRTFTASAGGSSFSRAYSLSEPSERRFMYSSILHHGGAGE